MHSPFAPLIEIAQPRPFPRPPLAPDPWPPSCDASCQKHPQDALQNLRPRLQTIENKRIYNAIDNHFHIPGDASCEKSPQNASPNFDPPSQPIERKWLITS